MPGEEQQGEYLPLSVAVAIAYGSLVAADRVARDQVQLDEHFDQVAAALASVTSVFMDGYDSAPKILSPELVARGRFRQGAQVLEPLDGSEPLSSLRVRAVDLYLAIEMLRQRLTLPLR